MPGKKSGSTAKPAPAPVVIIEPVDNGLEHDELEAVCKPSYSSMTLNEFLPDYVNKIPSGAVYIELFLFLDKTNIKQTDQCVMFTFCPSRINILDKTRKVLGFMPSVKLLSIYGDEFKLRMFESQYSKLSQTSRSDGPGEPERLTNINVINIDLTPKQSKSGNIYFKSYIQSVPSTNIKVHEALMKVYDQTPSAKYERPTEKTDDNGFDDQIEEL
jgi:hypothetical protein